MNGSEAVVQVLQQSGVEVMFGLCGDTSLPLYEALSALQPRIRHVLCRDERSAAYMADAYARFSGKVGVCEAPSGGGAMYLLPGVAEANQSSVPLVAITTDIDLRSRDRGTLTELDQSALFRPVTLWSRTPTDSEQLPRELREAFRRASTGRLGATHLGLPWNVQTGSVMPGVAVRLGDEVRAANGSGTDNGIAPCCCRKSEPVCARVERDKRLNGFDRGRFGPTSGAGEFRVPTFRPPLLNFIHLALE